MSKGDKNLRDAVDNVFRQTTPPTPTRVVQDVLSSSEESERQTASSAPSASLSSSNNAEKPIAPIVATKMSRPEASLTLPPPDVTPIDLRSSATAAASSGTGAATTADSSSVWKIIIVLALLIAIGLAVWQNYEPLRTWFNENILSKFSTTTATIQQPSADAAITASQTTTSPPALAKPSIADMIKMTTSSTVKQIPQPGQVDTPRKTVRIDESKNVVRMINVDEPPNTTGLATVLTTAVGVAPKVSASVPTVVVASPVVVQALPKDSQSADTAEMIRKLELSLDNLAKTSMDLQAQRDAAIAATTQRRDGAALRLDERDQFSRSERIAAMPVDDEAAGEAARDIYDRCGGNSVVGNRTMAPFVTFAPGEEPFDGMVPDYDERAHGASTALPPPLRSGEAHSIMELVSDHCLRTGKPQPKAADRSTLDVMSKKDTSTLSPLRTADCDGHYLQSQKKQFELQRLNQSAVKKIYEAKHASATGQILDRGSTVLSSFAGSQGEDAVQYLNVHGL